MKNSEDYVSSLCELGLSISQAKIYLSLVKYKKLKAQEIASISEVARPYVYGILAQLEEAGLVERTISPQSTIITRRFWEVSDAPFSFSE